MDWELDDQPYPYTGNNRPYRGDAPTFVAGKKVWSQINEEVDEMNRDTAKRHTCVTCDKKFSDRQRHYEVVDNRRLFSIFKFCSVKCLNAFEVVETLKELPNG